MTVFLLVKVRDESISAVKVRDDSISASERKG